MSNVRAFIGDRDRRGGQPPLKKAMDGGAAYREVVGTNNGRKFSFRVPGEYVLDAGVAALLKQAGYITGAIHPVGDDVEETVEPIAETPQEMTLEQLRAKAIELGADEADVLEMTAEELREIAEEI